MLKEVTFHSPVTTPEPEDPLPSENDSDIESTRAEVGTDDEPSGSVPAEPQVGEKMASTDTDGSSDATPEWTRGDDRTICVRKAEAKS
ncbi:hypothetical protein ONZ43_g6498 [Nemania bipapillata]|uniref:Uncharacterized protein n=1 Tax=Nemania bipapillata TaxID=110536 RepID=A0ACC2HYN4_9PEZI|nr:hypothetical protein ONZ43_g6498 [Nemania bipapillata]